jgi:hypothetical protein
LSWGTGDSGISAAGVAQIVAAGGTVLAFEQSLRTPVAVTRDKPPRHSELLNARIQPDAPASRLSRGDLSALPRRMRLLRFDCLDLRVPRSAAFGTAASASPSCLDCPNDFRGHLPDQCPDCRGKAPVIDKAADITLGARETAGPRDRKPADAAAAEGTP